MRLSGLLGQERAKAQLEAELEAGKTAHAYMFVGPKGVGRGTAAQSLFIALNCKAAEAGPGLFGDAPPSDEPCGQCGDCRRALAWQHEDLLVIEPPGDAASAQIKVESVREVIRSLNFAPLGGGTRLVLIREAQQMNQTAANALLKTLEEPPPDNIIMLTVQDPKELLPTIASRCRKVGFSPLSEDIVAEELVRRGAEPEAARLKAALSGGSLGRALELDQEQMQGRLRSFGEVLDRRADTLADWSFAEDMVGSFRGPQRIDRQGLAESLDLLCLLYRDKAVAAAGKADMAWLPGRSRPMNPAQAADAFSRVRRAQAEILGNASPELALTVLLGDLRNLSA